MKQLHDTSSNYFHFKIQINEQIVLKTQTEPTFFKKGFY